MYLFKRIGGVLLLGIYCLLIFAAVLYFGFWTGYRDRWINEASYRHAKVLLEPVRHVDESVMRLLGSVHQSKLSSFIHVDTVKPAGVTRVCALGDSSTQGDEVGDRHDYPSYLQHQFVQDGYDRVQVLNFGNGWYGFSQIYVMWKYVASRFDCDFVTLAPADFWSARDTTFNHSEGRFPAYLHARLVLDGDGLRLVAPLGETAEQRLEQYARAVPRWTYLHYDRHPPNILFAPLPAGRTIPNPFYYDRRPARIETAEIYRRLIREIADAGPQVLVLLKGPAGRKLYADLFAQPAADVAAALLDTPDWFPYSAPARHPSSWGQELTARSFFRLLTGSRERGFALAEMTDVPPAQAGDPEPLHHFDRVWMEFRGDRAGVLVGAKNRTADAVDEQVGIFRKQQVAALLYLAAPGGNLGNSCLLPLRAHPANGAELRFLPEGTAGPGIIQGVAHPIQTGLAIFKVELPFAVQTNCSRIDADLDPGAARPRGRLMLGETKVAELSGRKLLLPAGAALKLRETGEQLASIDSLQFPEELTLVLERDDGSQVRHVVATMRSKEFPARLEIKNPPLQRIGTVVAN